MTEVNIGRNFEKDYANIPLKIRRGNIMRLHEIEETRLYLWPFHR